MLYAIITAVVWTLDRLTKALVLRQLPLWSSRPLLGRILSLTHVQNTGAAFGLFRNQVFLLAAVTIALLVSLFFFRKHIEALGLWGRVGIALVLGGALGNLYDRLFFGYVVDFLEFPYFPVFNLADSAIVLGVGLLCLSIWTMDRGERQSASSSAELD